MRQQLKHIEAVVEEAVFTAVQKERRRQDEKCGVNWNLTRDRFQAIKTEEDLEVARAVNDKLSDHELCEELIQVAAVCVRFVTAIKLGGASP